MIPAPLGQGCWPASRVADIFRQRSGHRGRLKCPVGNGTIGEVEIGEAQHCWYGQLRSKPSAPTAAAGEPGHVCGGDRLATAGAKHVNNQRSKYRQSRIRAAEASLSNARYVSMRSKPAAGCSASEHLSHDRYAVSLHRTVSSRQASLLLRSKLRQTRRERAW